jgi:cytoskeletal protein CcmA (bactofilin family)
MAYIGVSPQNGVRKKHTYTASGSQTSFTGAGAEGITLSYKDSNFVDVYQNGVKLAEADYTSTSGTTIVLAQGAAANDIVEIIVYDVFSTSDMVSASDGGTFAGNVAMSGTLTLTGNGDFNGDLDVDGTLETDALTINGVTLAETISDTVGAMVSSNTETGITVTYQDGDNTLDFVVGTLNQDTTGTAANATLAATVTVTDSTANTNFPIVFHDESNALLDDTGALRYNPSTGELLVPKLTVAGTTTTVDTVTMNAANAVVFEGATADAHETTLTIVDPTADRTINLPNVSGTIPVLAAASNTAITSTPAELNLLDGITAGTVSASLAVIVDSNKDITGFRNVTLTGELDAGSLDISGDIDVDGTTNLDVVDIDGAVDMASTLQVDGAITTSSAMSITTTGVDPQLLLISTEAGANPSPQIDLYRNSSSPADGDTLGQLNYYGENSADEKILYTRVRSAIADVTDGDEGSNYTITTYTAGSQYGRLNINETETIFNENSADIDFRIESNTSANMFFVDGGNDHICINTSTDAGGVLNIKTTDNTANLVLFSTDNDANAGPLLDLMRDSSNPADNDAMGSIRFRGDDDAGNETQYVDVTAYAPDVSDGSEDGQLQFRSVVGGTLRNRFDINPTEVVFNEDGVSLNVRVESDNNANMLYIDGGYNIVGIGRVPATNDGGAGSLQLEGNDGLAMRRNGQTNSFILRPFSSGDGLRFTQGGTGDVAVIDSSGNFGIGTSSPTAKFEVAGNDPNPLMKFNQFQNADEVLLMMRHDYARTDSQTATMIQFQNNSNVEKGTIKTSLNATQFNTSSDYRLKENVNYTWDATTRLKQLKPARFNWISDDTNTLVDGFLAHEVQSIVPQAVDGNKDDMLVETKYTKDDVETQGDNPSKSVGDPKTYSSTEINPQGIDQSKLVPLLVKTIQELEARITALESA